MRNVYIKKILHANHLLPSYMTYIYREAIICVAQKADDKLLMWTLSFGNMGDYIVYMLLVMFREDKPSV